MPTKLKSTKRRTKVQDIAKKAKTLTGKDQKKIKGGLLPYIEQDNVYRSPNIKDGTSTTVPNK